MSILTVREPEQQVAADLYRFSVDEYHRMIDARILDDKRVELLEGYVVSRMTHNPPHASTIQSVEELMGNLLPTGWCRRIQSAITLSDSEPEPDVCVVRGDRRTYCARHPSPTDIGLVVEVSESTLPQDRAKRRIYARAGIGEYWIVNLVDRQIEVYTQPSGATQTPAYGHEQIYASGASVPVVLDGITLGHVAVNDLLP